MPRSTEHIKEHRWKPGQSGNPKGHKKGEKLASLSYSLKSLGIKKAKTRMVLANIADKIGYSPNECTNMDVVAGLIYDSVAVLLLKAVNGNADAGAKVAGLLELMFKATDGVKSEVSIKTSSDMVAAIAGVSTVLGFTPPGEAIPGNGRMRTKRTNGKANGKG